MKVYIHIETIITNPKEDFSGIFQINKHMTDYLCVNNIIINIIATYNVK